MEKLFKLDEYLGHVEVEEMPIRVKQSQNGKLDQFQDLCKTILEAFT